MAGHDGTGRGIDLVPVELAVGDQAVAAVEVHASDKSPLVFRYAAAGQPGDRLFACLTVVRRAVRYGQLVLLPGLRVRHDGADYDDGLYRFVDSVGDCAGLRLPRDEAGADTVLIGPKQAVRFVCSYLDPVPSPAAVVESPTVQVDYRSFARLWTDMEGLGPGLLDLEFRWLEIVSLGETVGEMHSKGILHGDAHEGNFSPNIGGKAGVFDRVTTRVLYCPAEPVQCATDLIPLMTGFSAWDWYNFKRGYLLAWPEGQRVFDLIELRDRTGWMYARRHGDYQAALRLLDEAVRLVEEDDVSELARLIGKRAECLSNLGQHAQALQAQAEAIRLVEESHVPGLGWEILNLALLHRHAGDDATAVAVLERFLARSGDPVGADQAIAEARELLRLIHEEAR